MEASKLTNLNKIRSCQRSKVSAQSNLVSSNFRTYVPSRCLFFLFLSVCLSSFRIVRTYFRQKTRNNCVYINANVAKSRWYLFSRGDECGGGARQGMPKRRHKQFGILRMLKISPRGPVPCDSGAVPQPAAGEYASFPTSAVIFSKTLHNIRPRSVLVGLCVAVSACVGVQLAVFCFPSSTENMTKKSGRETRWDAECGIQCKRKIF